MGEVVRLKDVIAGVPGATVILWTEMCSIIANKLRKKKGIRVPNFARFTFLKKAKNKQICLFERTFKNGLRTHGLPNPQEVPCSDLNYVELSRRVGITKDACITTLGHVIKYISGLAYQGERLELRLKEVGVFWAKSSAIGFRYLSPAQAAALTRSKRSAVGGHSDQFSLTGQAAGSNNAALQQPGGSERVPPPGSISDEEALPEEDVVPAAKNAGPESSSMPPPAPSAARTPLLSSQRVTKAKGSTWGGPGEVSEPSEAERLLQSLQLDREKSRSGKNSVLPVFLVPDLNQSAYTNNKLRGITNKRDVAVKIAYQRHQDSIRTEQERLNDQHRAIADRHKQANFSHQMKRRQFKEDQAQYLQTLLSQAKDKRDSDVRERYRRRTMRDPDPSRMMPQEGDKDWNRHEKIKSSLRRTLDRQVNLRKQRKDMEKRVDIAEQRFFLDCVQKQLMEDRTRRRDITSKQNSMLQDEWRKQQESNAVKNNYLKKLYGSGL